MSRERELLERAYYVLGELSYAILKDSGEYNLAGDIYEFLAEPEVKREALSLTKLGTEYQYANENEFDWFIRGVSFAEKHHGIGGEE